MTICAVTWTAVLRPGMRQACPRPAHGLSMWTNCMPGCNATMRRWSLMCVPMRNGAPVICPTRYTSKQGGLRKGRPLKFRVIGRWSFIAAPPTVQRWDCRYWNNSATAISWCSIRASENGGMPGMKSSKRLHKSARSCGLWYHSEQETRRLPAESYLKRQGTRPSIRIAPVTQGLVRKGSRGLAGGRGADHEEGEIVNKIVDFYIACRFSVCLPAGSARGRRNSRKEPRRSIRDGPFRNLL